MSPSLPIIVWIASIFSSNARPLCSYINFKNGLGTPLNTCHPEFNNGLERSYEYLCFTGQGYYRVTHANHLCINGPLTFSQNITQDVLYGDCHDSDCTNNLLSFTTFTNENCTEDYQDEYVTNILLINECMVATSVVTTPPTNACEVFCNDEFFQIGYFSDADCNENIPFPVRFYFDQCSEIGVPKEFYKLIDCTDPINGDVLNKYPYRNGTKSDFDSFVKNFLS